MIEIQRFLLTHVRTVHLIETFLVFILIQTVFAGVYFALYRCSRTNFSFNLDVLKQQSTLKRGSIEQKNCNLIKASQAVIELRALLEEGVSPVQLSKWSMRYMISLPSGMRCRTSYQPATHPKEPSAGFFTIVDSNENPILTIDQFAFDGGVLGMPNVSDLCPRNLDEWRNALPDWQNEVNRRREEAAEQVSSLDTNSPDVWTYWDFLYFSTITQTTVGFGDILPNSTPIRMLVSGQILAGYALLVVVLNIVLAG